MSNDPAVRHALAQHTSRSSGRQLADVIGTFVVLGLLVMTTDPCAHQKCGDPTWLDRAMNLNLWAAHEATNLLAGILT